jgi:hypothetical protein
MVNNSTNINKTITSHLNSLNIKKGTMIDDVGNPDPDLGQPQKCVWVKQLMGFQPSPLDNWVSKGNTCNKQCTCYVSCCIPAHLHTHITWRRKIT